MRPIDAEKVKKWIFMPGAKSKDEFNVLLEAGEFDLPRIVVEHIYSREWDY